VEENIHLVACVRRETEDRVWQFVCQRAQHVRMELGAAAQEKNTKILYRYQACDMQGIHLRFFSLNLANKLVGSGQNDKNSHRPVRFGFAQATKLPSQGFWKMVAVVT
jgi:hypothetical protein